MPSLDSWLEITIRTPFLLLLMLAFLLIGLIVGGALAYRRLLARIKRLSNEAQALQAQLARHAEQEAQGTAARESYRHFIHNLSHEVSNPLQSIQTNLDNMAGCSLDEAGRWRQYHAIIAAEVRRLRGLTENLRLLSRLETPDAPTVREPVNLKGVVEDVIMALSETAEARGVRLRYVGPERPARVLGDRDRLRQALLNLADNGIKYSKPGGGEVIISLQEERDRLWVRVSDEGVGIAEEDLPHIFDIAYRAPDARSFRRQGSGLGLAIVKRIVEQHGGTVRVQSRLGEGTTVSFGLPVYVPA
jgi:two-component system phosphate regulon sensor histidine kinase PhoR